MKDSIFKLAFFVFLTLYSLGICAQSGAIVINSENGSEFQLSINNILQQPNYYTAIKITQLKSELNYKLVITFKSDTTKVLQNIYIIDDGLINYYSLNKKELKLIKILPPALNISNPNEPLTSALIINPLDQLAESVEDSILTITPEEEKFKDHFKMDDYQGKIGCAWPLKEDEIKRIKNAIKSENLPDSKLESAKRQIEETDSLCFTMDQIREIIQLFEYEESRLDIALHLAPFIFDKDNIGKLKDVFDFENSLEELKKRINQQ